MPAKKTTKSKKEEFKISTDDVVKKIKQIIQEGNARRIIVKDGKGKVILEIPVSVAAVGTVLAPILAAVGVLVAMVKKCTIVVERK